MTRILLSQVINELPESHRKVFYYVILFIKEVLRHSNINRLEPNFLCEFAGDGVLNDS